MQSYSTAEQVAAYLLEIEAIKLRPEMPFKWSSGWNSPIYCDNRLTLSYPPIRTYIKNALLEAIKVSYPDAEAIAGVATAGIPQGALVAEMLNLPFLYVRSSPKGHGMENLIEGKVVPGQKVVLVEDLISTGGSSLKVAASLKNAGFEVLGMVAIFTYGFDEAERNFKEAGVDLHCLSNYEVMLKVALQKDYIKSEMLGSLEEWRRQPSTWSI
jgi:orotate phosphoribosyltransferase